ncbi:MAG: peptidoglycan bridge formation glycyltransferase FemA/FemB family protein, partial [Candidatus Fimenecus sp.]
MSDYKFSEQKDLDLFNGFSEKNGGSIYQTSYWAQVKNAWKPSFYMGYENDTPVLSALCLERDVKVGKLWYCPDGFVCDLKNEELVAAFCAFM